jgi:CBS domain-containing protein
VREPFQGELVSLQAVPSVRTLVDMGPHPLSILRREFLARTVEVLSPRAAVTVTGAASQVEAVEAMNGRKAGSVLVATETGELEGIVTERDVLLRWQPGVASHAGSVRALMSPNPQVLKSNASIARLVHLMASGGYRHVPILDSDGAAPRMLSSKDFVDNIHRRLTSKLLDPNNAVTVAGNVVDLFFDATLDVLQPDPPLVINSTKRVADALEMMRKRGRGAVVITDLNHHIIGIFTERDYLTKVVLEPRTPEEITIVEKMTGSPRTLQTSASVAVGFGLLSEGGYRHLPLVSTEERLVGILSVRNVLTYLSASIVSALGGPQSP